MRVTGCIRVVVPVLLLASKALNSQNSEQILRVPFFVPVDVKRPGAKRKDIPLFLFFLSFIPKRNSKTRYSEESGVGAKECIQLLFPLCLSLFLCSIEGS